MKTMKFGLKEYNIIKEPSLSGDGLCYGCAFNGNNYHTCPQVNYSLDNSLKCYNGFIFVEVKEN